MCWAKEIFIFLSLLFVVSWSYKQNYEVQLERFELRSTEGQTTFGSSTLRQIGRNRVVNGSFVLLEDLNAEHFEVSGNAYGDTSGSGDFHPMPFSLSNMSPCDAMANYGKYTYPTLKEGGNTNFPVNGKECPIPKKEYYFKELFLQPDNWPSSLPRGLMKAILFLRKDNVAVGELEIIFTVRNKWA